MTTTEQILVMALQVAEAGRASGECAKVTIRRRHVESSVVGTVNELGYGIDVEPKISTGSWGLGTFEMIGEGLTLDEAARDLLQSVYRADELIRARVAEETGRNVRRMQDLDAVMGRFVSREEARGRAAQ